MSARSRKLTVSQLLVALLSFLLLCGVGGGLLAAMAIPVAATSGTAANAVTRIFDDLPTEISFTEPSEQSVILAADGSHIATFYSENRIVVSSEDISQFIKDAAVAIEDERFYQHNGIDAQGIIGAAFTTLTGGGLAGGSTITQQYVKNALIEEGRIAGNDAMINSATERSIARKINEARFAIAVENQMTKDQILTGYLNVAQFGPSQWGVEAASQYYYSKPASEVTLEQAAMLVGITQAPGRWDPVRNPNDAKVRRDTVLGSMYGNGYITRDQLDAAAAVPIEDMLNVTPSRNGCEDAGTSAYFCEYVVKEVLNSELLGETREERIQKLYRGGLVIHTTIDPAEQQMAFDALTAQIPVGDPSGISMAMSTVEPNTGHIRAMVQNTTFGNPTEEDPYATKVNANVGEDHGGGAGFQPGSTFKIFTLVEWLASGHSAYERVNGANNQVYERDQWIIPCAPGYADRAEPGNNEGAGWGMMSVTDATKNSVNTAYMNMSSKLDQCAILDLAKEMGVERGTLGTQAEVDRLTNAGLQAEVGQPLPLEPFPIQVLGITPVTPLSMANSMATLAAEGNACEVQSWTKISDTSGETIAEQTPNCRQVLDRETARATTSVLTSVPTSSGTGYRAILDGGRQSAGKTGTTNNAWHAWYVGYTPQLATAVWTGHMTGNISMTHVTVNGNYIETLFGSTLPAPAFKQFMDAALAGEPNENFTPPSRSVTQEPTVGIPNVVGMSEGQAVDALQQAGFTVAVGTDYSDLPEGQVARQSPTGRAREGARVDLWLSIGPDPAEAEPTEEESDQPADDAENN